MVAGCCSELFVCFTCSVLSNQRLQLFHWLPPPCSIWIAAQLWYISSATLGIAPSKHRVKMLLWIADTDSLFLSSRKKTEQRFKFTLSVSLRLITVVDFRLDVLPQKTSNSHITCSKLYRIVFVMCFLVFTLHVAVKHRAGSPLISLV